MGVGDSQWFATTSATTLPYMYVNGFNYQQNYVDAQQAKIAAIAQATHTPAPAAEPYEPTGLDWLRARVDEIRDLAFA